MDGNKWINDKTYRDKIMNNHAKLIEKSRKESQEFRSEFQEVMKERIQEPETLKEKALKMGFSVIRGGAIQ